MGQTSAGGGMHGQETTAAASSPQRTADDRRDSELATAQAALLARYAPETRAYRVAWSQGETQVLELGQGRPLLLLHGGGDAAFEWVPILPALAQSHRVFAVDRPGHGLADPFYYEGVDLFDHARTFLRDILDALELRTVDIVANSMGGLWSVVFALDNPDRVSRLALVGAPPGVIRGVPLQLRIFGLPLIGQAIGRRLLSNPTREGNRKFWGQMLVSHPERLSDDLLDADVAHTRRNGATILSLIRSLGTIRGLHPHLVLGARWQELKVPTLFLWGENDIFMTTRMQEAWKAIETANPNIRVVSIPGIGHLPWIDEPDRTVGEIDRFLVEVVERT